MSEGRITEGCESLSLAKPGLLGRCMWVETRMKKERTWRRIEGTTFQAEGTAFWETLRPAHPLWEEEEKDTGILVQLHWGRSLA